MEELNGNFNKAVHKEVFVSTGVLPLLLSTKKGKMERCFILIECQNSTAFLTEQNKGLS